MNTSTNQKNNKKKTMFTAKENASVPPGYKYKQGKLEQDDFLLRHSGKIIYEEVENMQM